MNPELEAANPTVLMIQLIIMTAPVTDTVTDATMLRLVPAPVTDMGVDATMLRLVTATVTDMGVDATMLRLVTATVTCTGGNTTMDPNSEDERTAKAHVYQTSLASAHGKELRNSNIGDGIGAIDDSRYDQPSNVNMTSRLHT